MTYGFDATGEIRFNKSDTNRDAQSIQPTPSWSDKFASASASYNHLDDQLAANFTIPSGAKKSISLVDVDQIDGETSISQADNQRRQRRP